MEHSHTIHGRTWSLAKYCAEIEFHKEIALNDTFSIFCGLWLKSNRKISTAPHAAIALVSEWDYEWTKNLKLIGIIKMSNIITGLREKSFKYIHCVPDGNGQMPSHSICFKTVCRTKKYSFLSFEPLSRPCTSIRALQFVKHTCWMRHRCKLQTYRAPSS